MIIDEASESSIIGFTTLADVQPTGLACSQRSGLKSASFNCPDISRQYCRPGQGFLYGPGRATAPKCAFYHRIRLWVQFTEHFYDSNAWLSPAEPHRILLC